jgi:hypothetical protein
VAAIHAAHGQVQHHVDESADGVQEAGRKTREGRKEENELLMEVFSNVSVGPLTRLLSHRFPPCPSLTGSEATTSEPRTPLHSPPSSRLDVKEMQIINLECATARAFAFVAMPIDTPTLSPSPS